MATFFKTNESPVGDFICFNFPENLCKAITPAWWEALFHQCTYVCSFCHQGAQFAMSTSSHALYKTDSKFQSDGLPPVPSALVPVACVLVVVTWCCSLWAATCYGLMDGGPTCGPVSRSGPQTPDAAEQGKRRSTDCPSRTLLEASQGKPCSKMEYFKLLDKKIH